MWICRCICCHLFPSIDKLIKTWYIFKSYKSITIFIFIKVIFTLAPNKSVDPVRINVGAIFTSLGFIVVTHFYGYYVNHFAKYDIFYAGLSNVMVLLLWIYFLSNILVIGISLTTEVNEEDLPKSGKLNF